MAELVSLSVADPPDLWRSLGFTVDQHGCQVGSVTHFLVGEGKGILAWGLHGLDGWGARQEIDGVRTSSADPAASEPPAHLNTVIGLDHVVLLTPDLERTVAAFEDVGVPLRRTRDSDTYGRPMRQAFFRLGEVILEVVGRPGETGDGPCRFYGLAFTVSNLARTAGLLGDRLHPAKDAVQPGRRIATLDRSAGSRLAMAFMSPPPDHGENPT